MTKFGVPKIVPSIAYCAVVVLAVISTAATTTSQKTVPSTAKLLNLASPRAIGEFID
jgi:hypothetical protein